MYCKYCGKEISENSKFCKYCGKLVDDSEQLQLEVNQKDDKLQKEISVSATIENPIKVELSRKQGDKKYKSVVANEIVANLKMIGCAIIICIVYCIGFTIFHLKDIAKVPDDSSYGESCYDRTMYNYRLTWEEYFFDNVFFYDRNFQFSTPSSDDYARETNLLLTKEAYLSRANKIAEEKNLNESEISILKEEAKEEAKSAKEEFYDDLNRKRKYLFKEDLKKHITWSGIIALALMILGRYVAKSVNWVNNNKTN